MGDWSWLLGLEAFLFFGLAFGWGWWELATVRRLLRRRAEPPGEGAGGGRGGA